MRLLFTLFHRGPSPLRLGIEFYTSFSYLQLSGRMVRVTLFDASTRPTSPIRLICPIRLHHHPCGSRKSVPTTRCRHFQTLFLPMCSTSLKCSPPPPHRKPIQASLPYRFLQRRNPLIPKLNLGAARALSSACSC